MISETKYAISDSEIVRLFQQAGIPGATRVAPLGNGEFSAVFSVSTPERAYVLKIAPPDDGHIMTYEKNMMYAEVFWYRMIRAHTDIRVPEIVFVDFSLERLPAAYFIMERLEGETLPKAGLGAGERGEASAELARMLAKIHVIPGERFGYEQGDVYESWYEAIRGMAVRTLEDCRNKSRRSRRGERLLRSIDRYRAVLDSVSPCMVNFDLWPSNVIASREEGSMRLAWIDPERSFWGDPVVDFVCLAFSRPLKRAKSAVAAYNGAAGEPVEISRETEIRYAIGQGYLALIMETEKYYRYSPRRFGWWRNVIAAWMLYRAAFAVLEA